MSQQYWDEEVLEKALNKISKYAVVFDKTDFEKISKNSSRYISIVNNTSQDINPDLPEEVLKKIEHFIDVAKNDRSPQTPFEFAWKKIWNLIGEVEEYELKKREVKKREAKLNDLERENRLLKEEKKLLELRISEMDATIERLRIIQREPKILEKNSICPHCNGDGGVNGGCSLCEGRGYIQ